MTAAKFCVSSPFSLGCTFLDWSIHWLMGHDRYYSTQESRWIPLTQDPLSGHNAHGHARNICSGLSGAQELIDLFPDLPGVYSFYPTDLPMDVCCQRLGISIDQLRDHTHDVLDYQMNDYRTMLEYIAVGQKIPLVLVAFDASVLGYLWETRTLDRKRFSPGPAESKDSMDQEFEQIFFDAPDKESPLYIWDRRERMALDLRPFDKPHYLNLTTTAPHHWINCEDLWFDTERTLRRAMSWLGYQVVEDRLLPWRAVVARWQLTHHDNLKFSRELDQIVYSTVRGHYHEIPNLTLKQEAIVQHCLIYQHGLNLRSWGLEKFPKNTIELHNLLEPNQHPLG